GFIIRPKENKRIPFTYLIPTDIPISTHSVTFYFETQLDIQSGNLGTRSFKMHKIESIFCGTRKDGFFSYKCFF
ncbi:sporulation protein, partial [Bacillus cereus]